MVGGSCGFMGVSPCVESNFFPAPGNFPQRTAANTRSFARSSRFFRCNKFGCNRNATETTANRQPRKRRKPERLNAEERRSRSSREEILYLQCARLGPFWEGCSDSARMNVPSGRVVKKPVSRSTSRMMPHADASRPHRRDAC